MTLWGVSWGPSGQQGNKNNGSFSDFALGNFRIPGPTLDPTWAILVPTWAILDPSGPGPSWTSLGRLLGLPGRPKGSLWRPLVGTGAPLGALLTPLGGHLGPS